MYYPYISLEAFEGATLTSLVQNMLLRPYSTDSVFIDYAYLYTLNKGFH